MPENEVIERARRDAQEGKSPSTQAGEFVREEIEHVRQGKHGARSPKQAIAIGLSKARRAGIPLPRPKRGTTSTQTRRKAARDQATDRGRRRSTSPKRSRATLLALRREGRQAASKRALAAQARRAARARRGRTAAVGRKAPSRKRAGAGSTRPSEMRRP